MTSDIPTHVFGLLTPANTNDGGLAITGASDNANIHGLRLSGIIGVEDPTDTTAAVTIDGQKKSGTSFAALGSSETILRVKNQMLSSSSLLTVLGGGNVGIGTDTPSQKLTVNGSLNVSANMLYGGNLTGYGADFAEMMKADEKVSAGDVVCLNEKMNIMKCSMRAQNSVVGVVSSNPTITGNAKNGNIPVGIVGILKVKVTGKIARYDMLTTSSRAGYAEKATAADFGAIIGKVMEPCPQNECLINVLIGLR